MNALVGTAGQSPTVSTVHLAMVHGAVYDAVNSIDERYEPYLVEVRARDWYSKDAAAATAAYRVLVGIVPAQQPALTSLYEASLASIPAGPAKDGGVIVGEIAAAAMLTARMGDGRGGVYRFPAPATPQDPWPVGQWRPVLPAFGNDPAAWIKDVKPFLIRDPARYATAARTRSRASSYTREFNEVKAIGSLVLDHAHGGPDRPGAFLGRGPAAVDPRRPPARHRPRPAHDRDRADVRDALHDRRGRPDQHRGATRRAGCSGARSPRSATPTPTATRTRPPTRRGCR